jgi:hypothetical protein
MCKESHLFRRASRSEPGPEQGPKPNLEMHFFYFNFEAGAEPRAHTGTLTLSEYFFYCECGFFLISK